jgi:hypothetical protein
MQGHPSAYGRRDPVFEKRVVFASMNGVFGQKG